MPRPKKIKVGPHWYTVRIDKDLGNVTGKSGICGPSTQLILLEDGLGKTMEKDTLLHETLHAMIEQLSVDMEDAWNDEMEERLLFALAPVLLGVLRDNPDFVEWLTEE